MEVVAVDYRMFDEVVAQLRMAGLEPRDSCGSSVRNPIPCPSNHCPPSPLPTPRPSPHSSGITSGGRAEYEGVNMPHRLKISVSGCGEACAVPASQDVGDNREGGMGGDSTCTWGGRRWGGARLHRQTCIHWGGGRG